MSWCPQCKNEYREGIKTCAECGVALVDELPDETEKELLFTAPNEEIASQFVKFLEHEGIQDYEQKKTDWDEIEIYLSQKDLIIAKKLLVAFSIAVTNNEEGKEITFDDLELPSDDDENGIEKEQGMETLRDLKDAKSSIYTKSADKYNDFKFSGYSFLGFAVIGFAIIILNGLHILNFLTTFSMVIMTAVFIIFVFVGIQSLMMAAKVKSSIGEEETRIDEIKNWMKEEFTDEYFKALLNEEFSEEHQYFIYLEDMNQKVMKKFPTSDSTLIEELTDEYLNQYLD